MKLLLMRHGEAGFNAASDRQRELTERGRGQVRAQLANAAAALAQATDLYASPYRRTQQTAQLVSAAQAHLQAQAPQPLITPDGRCDQVQDWLLQLDGNPLLVTHQPLISELIYFLSGRSQAMKPASIAWLEGEVMARDCMTLTQVWHPQG